jgi:hypothetical protein
MKNGEQSQGVYARVVTAGGDPKIYLTYWGVHAAKEVQPRILHDNLNLDTGQKPDKVCIRQSYLHHQNCVCSAGEV